MYKYIEDGVVITWEPLDKNLGIAIVKEVTNKTSTAEKLVEVTAVEREQILKLYAERKNDPIVEVEIDVEPQIVKEMQEKIDRLEGTVQDLILMSMEWLIWLLILKIIY